jgi:hypothetical protein
VFLRGYETVWVWTQTSWTNTGQQVSKMAAGDGQLFGLDAAGRLKRYRTNAWLSEPSGFIGDKLAVGGGMNDSPGDDIAFVLLADDSLRTWQPG